MPSLKTNALAFAAIQVAEYLVPLLAVPYLIRVLGVKAFGDIAFSQAACVAFVILVDYGFNLAASRSAAVARSDKEELSKLFWNVQVIKVLLLFVSTSVLLMLTMLIKQFGELRTLLLICMLPALGSVIYPLWLFQGLEMVRKTAPLILLFRLTLLAGILFFVKSPQDINLAALLLMGPMPLAGMATWFFIYRNRLVRWRSPSFRELLIKMTEGRHAFIATAASSLYRSTNAIVLGFTSGSLAVGYYSVCEKIIRVSQELSKPVSQATYPRISYLAQHDPLAARMLLLRMLWVIGGIGLTASCLLLVFAPTILRLVGGENLAGAIFALRAMALVPFIGSLNLVLGVQTMHPFGHAREFSKLVLYSGIFNSILIFPMSHFFGATGAATTYLASEILLLANLIGFSRSMRAKNIRSAVE